MIYDDEIKIKISGNTFPWEAHYSREQFNGPLSIFCDGEPLLLSCATQFDALPESLVLPDRMKAFRKGKSAIVQAKGKMPVGSSIGYHYAHRFSDSSLKVVKDFYIPRSTFLKNKFVVDQLTLPMDFVSYQLLDETMSLTSSKPFELPLTMEGCPLSIILEKKDGTQLEISLGYDLWRWKKGLLGEDNNLSFALEQSGDTMTLSRIVTAVKEETEIEARAFRFSWLMAFGKSKSQEQYTNDKEVALTYRPNGDVAMGQLAKALEKDPDASVVIDLKDFPCAEALHKSDTALPCFSSGQFIKRLKRVMRQLAAFKGVEFPLRFENMIPAVCMKGGHANSRDLRKHWDLSAILDFAVWARQSMGNERLISNDYSALDIPSLRYLFAPTSHEDSAVEYEFEFPKDS